jgi:hypothetical protein
MSDFIDLSDDNKNRGQMRLPAIAAYRNFYSISVLHVLMENNYGCIFASRDTRILVD